jgi:hypothetical protein
MTDQSTVSPAAYKDTYNLYFFSKFYESQKTY